MLNAATFRERHPSLVWSNTQAEDAVWIRAALLQPRFHTLLDACLGFGLERVQQEWDLLRREAAEEAKRAESETSRILRHIAEGFAEAQGGGRD